MAVEIVGGAVDRIDAPTHAARSFAAGAFLAEHSIVRARREECAR